MRQIAHVGLAFRRRSSNPPQLQAFAAIALHPGHVGAVATGRAEDRQKPRGGGYVVRGMTPATGLIIDHSFLPEICFAMLRYPSRAREM